MAQTRKAAVLYGPGDVRIEERSVPEPGPDEVLVRVTSVGVCGSDVHYFEHGRIADFVVRNPMVLGHEGAGVVVASGPGVAVAPGTRVAMEPGIPCGRCRVCRAGRYNLCPDVAFFATPPFDGLFCEYVVTKADFVHPLPDSLSDEAGAMIEPLSVGLWANRKAGVRAGSRVLVTGSGPIGVLAALVAKASGAAHVTVTDINTARLDQARHLGVDETVDVSDGLPTLNVQPDTLIECTGLEDVICDAVESLASGGTAVFVGMSPHERVQVPLGVIQSREIAVHGCFRYANTYPEAIALAASGAVDLDGIVGARLPLDRVVDALQMGKTEPEVLKTMVTVTE